MRQPGIKAPSATPAPRSGLQAPRTQTPKAEVKPREPAAKAEPVKALSQVGFLKLTLKKYIILRQQSVWMWSLNDYTSIGLKKECLRFLLPILWLKLALSIDSLVSYFNVYFIFLSLKLLSLIFLHIVVKFT